MTDYKQIHIRDVPTRKDGTRPSITRLYMADQGWNSHACDCPLPQDADLFTFTFKAGPLNLLVLDPYGDETLLGRMRKRLLGSSDVNTTIGIDWTTGQIYFFGFGIEEGKLVAVVWRSPPNGTTEMKVPRRFLKKLDQVKSKKRPFCFSVETSALIGFCDRAIGYNELCNNLSLSLRFDDFALELWGDRAWRKVSFWK